MEKYAKDNGFKNIQHFTDDGYTGTNFKRPAWQDNDFTPFLNIINEFYVRDTSKKIRAVMKLISAVLNEEVA